MASKKDIAEKHAEIAERYAARMRSKAGQKNADDDLSHYIHALMLVELTRDEGSIARAESTSAAAVFQAKGWGQVAIMRSDAAYDMHADGIELALRCHYLGDINKSREEQIRKKTSGGKHQVEIYRRQFGMEPPRAS